MEASCTWVASADWFDQAVVLSTLIVGFGLLATSRGRQLVSELASDDEAPDPQVSPVSA